jgi:hypothetical protein
MVMRCLQWAVPAKGYLTKVFILTLSTDLILINSTDISSHLV